MSTETARQRRQREFGAQLVANDAVGDFASDVAEDFRAADREIDRLTRERDTARAELAVAREALEAIARVCENQGPASQMEEVEDIARRALGTLRAGEG